MDERRQRIKEREIIYMLEKYNTKGDGGEILLATNYSVHWQPISQCREYLKFL